MITIEQNILCKVKKHSGELVPFEPNSLKQSLSRSGASDQDVENVFQSIQQNLYDGISTKELYKMAFDLLKNQRDSYAARYSLKKALRELGPEGFYFEKWIARLFADEGYKSINGQTVQGHAVSHEIDVVALKGDKMLAVECKFRNDIEAKISVTTPMYFMSRVKDISNLPFTFFGGEYTFTEGWLVTNAYFTSDSTDFGEYYKMNLLSWNYPKNSSIKVRVDNNGLYPVTCLTCLSDAEKGMLLKNQCILVKELLDNPSILQSVHVNPEKAKKILKEANELINSPVQTEH
ncbi:putative holliday junction resolvase Hjc [Sphingobacterium spiritivorum ATCC 33300]|uniref:Putative holliday junction resolvase Hjc n=1 Tax=Sphingobacterium spiritivorum ATCC 33300 TaxID=525372 RepID=C2FUV8_SPHSI|nr:ATP cone domain-containing protein [Sphingobacterium spiritivorum]EEI93312.1 putative holliday junction resolvase Hjc [Sphingobacterium spiritivorum ATCC 33300]